MESTIEKRLHRFRHLMSEAAMDTLLILVAENRRYLSGFTGEDTQFDESAGALFITQRHAILATDSRYELQARAEAPLYNIYCYRQGLAKALPEILADVNTRRLGFEENRLSVEQHRKFSEQMETEGLSVALTPARGLVETLRVQKEASEVEAIRTALHLAEDVFRKAAPAIQPGVTEQDVAWAIEKGMREAGAEAVSFPTIVASGPNSALPHAVPGRRRLKPGEPILFDWGARQNGYCSDISRTCCIGPPDETFRKVFQVVHDAQQLAIDAIRAGVSTKQIDAIARRYIEENGFKGKFGHGLGHGTGLSIHENPRLSPLTDRPLEAGMVTTVEPGIYLPDWGGIRLENMIVVRQDGAEVLNRLKTTGHAIGADADDVYG